MALPSKDNGKSPSDDIPEFLSLPTNQRHEPTLSRLAVNEGVSGPYLYDMEQGTEILSRRKHLEDSWVLRTGWRRNRIMLDLACIDCGIVPLDLLEFILNNAHVRVALRKAKKRIVRHSACSVTAQYNAVQSFYGRGLRINKGNTEKGYGELLSENSILFPYFIKAGFHNWLNNKSV